MHDVGEVAEPVEALHPVHPVELQAEVAEGPGMVLDVDADDTEACAAIALGCAAATAEEIKQDGLGG